MTGNTYTKENYMINVEKLISNKVFGIVFFSVLVSVAAQFTIPTRPVPITLQSLIVIMAGAFLGSKNGAYSMLLYLFMGCIGLPVFAYGSFGAWELAKSTGGYLLAFPFAAYMTGLLIERNDKYFVVALALLLGEVVISIIGTLFLNSVLIHDFATALKFGVEPFIIWSFAKVFFAASLFVAVKKNIANKKLF